MYAKCVRRFLELLSLVFELVIIFFKMYQNNIECAKNKRCSSSSQNYIFKPLHYEKVVPNQESRVPVPRSGHRIGADSSNLYSFGGYNPWTRFDLDEDDGEFYPLFQELWKFNFASKRWIKFPNGYSMPSELASSALVLHGNVLMIFGGTATPFGEQCSNRLHICRLNENTGIMVEIEATGDLPKPLYGQAMIYHDQYLYTIGGTCGVSYNCDVHRFNLNRLEWEALYLSNFQGDYEPEGRYRHEVGFVGQKIYVLGGGTYAEAYGFRNVPAFDIKKRMWTRQKTRRDPNHGYPSARRCHGAVQINNGKRIQVFITGGQNNTHIFRDLWRLDLTTYEWTCFPTCQLPNPTYFHAAAVTPEGRLYVFGGNYHVGNQTERSNDIYSAWLCIPKLSEICWEALLCYCPHISKCDFGDIGVPKRFLDRIKGIDK